MCNGGAIRLFNSLRQLILFLCSKNYGLLNCIAPSGTPDHQQTLPEASFHTFFDQPLSNAWAHHCMDHHQILSYIKTKLIKNVDF